MKLNYLSLISSVIQFISAQKNYLVHGYVVYPGAEIEQRADGFVVVRSESSSAGTIKMQLDIRVDENISIQDHRDRAKIDHEFRVFGFDVGKDLKHLRDLAQAFDTKVAHLELGARNDWYFSDNPQSSVLSTQGMRSKVEKIVSIEQVKGDLCLYGVKLSKNLTFGGLEFELVFGVRGKMQQKVLKNIKHNVCDLRDTIPIDEFIKSPHTFLERANKLTPDEELEDDPYEPDAQSSQGSSLVTALEEGKEPQQPSSSVGQDPSLNAPRQPGPEPEEEGLPNRPREDPEQKHQDPIHEDTPQPGNLPGHEPEPAPPSSPRQPTAQPSFLWRAWELVRDLCYRLESWIISCFY